MEIKHNFSDKVLIVDKVTIIVGDREFRINVNRLGELVINKTSYGDDSSSIAIIPRVSNEIEIK